jgi:hypothetical protein
VLCSASLGEVGIICACTAWPGPAAFPREYTVAASQMLRGGGVRFRSQQREGDTRSANGEATSYPCRLDVQERKGLGTPDETLGNFVVTVVRELGGVWLLLLKFSPGHIKRLTFK